MNIGEYLIHLALIELANRAADNNLYFDYERSSVVFVKTQDPDYKPLEKYKKLFGGGIFTPEDSWSFYGSLDRGEYSWGVKDREAYLLCRALEPYLVKYARNKFPYCQALMMEYMVREGNPYR